MDIENYTIEELANLKNKISKRIRDYKDGYLYICIVTSHGEMWRDKSIHNVYAFQELCDVYSDYEDSKVDVFSTNPNFDVQKPMGVHRGTMKYIESTEDFNKWVDYNDLINNIKELEIKADTSEEFKDELTNLKSKLEEYDTSFTEPEDYPII
jgi:hypothetical protein